MSKKEVNHVAQEPHKKEDCKINERPHNHPDVDCGHSVDEIGPGTSGEHTEGGPGHTDCNHK